VAPARATGNFPAVLVARHYSSGGTGGHDEHMRKQLATGLFAVALAEALAAYVVGPLSGLGAERLSDLLILSNATLGLALAAAGWPIAAYRPDTRIGWLLLGGGVAYGSTGGGMVVLHAAGDQDSPLWRVVATVVSGGWTLALALFLPLALVLFPDGHLPDRRWRWLVGLAAVNGPLFFTVGMISGYSGEVGVTGYLVTDAGWAYGLFTAAGLGLLATWLGTLACVVVRFRRGGDRLRRQLLWVMLALLLVAVLFLLDPVLPDNILTVYAIALVPLAILIAVFRHRVLDIRLVFSRSLLYVLLTGAAVAAYLAIVAVLGRGAPVLATVLVAVAFNPARVWLQRRVERAVYGARRDPVQAMAAVGARLTGTGLDGVLRALCDVLRLPSATVVYDSIQLASHGRAPELLTAVPLVRDGERVGELIVGLRYGESRLDPADERVLGLLAAPIAVAVHATRLADDLARSREQVITTREEERRRLRRDLHDGLGPVLTGVVLDAETALRLVHHDPDRSAALLAQLRDRTTGALDDIRRLVYDLRPPALDSLGLVGALEEYATMLPLPVTVDVPEPLGELPAAVEVAAYRIVTEALTNVTRHSSAGSAVVVLEAAGGELRVSVHDDGVNVGGGWQSGVGLTSIRERAAELGGRCSIQLDRTGGRVDVHLPVVVASRVGA